MIHADEILGKILAEEKKFNLSSKVILKDYIKKYIKIETDSKELCVVCPPWGFAKYAIRPLTFKLSDAKISYLIYSIDQDLLSADYKSTRKYIKEVIRIIEHDTRHAMKMHKFSKVTIVGLSLGAIYATSVGNRIKEIDRVILVTPGNAVGEIIWDALYTGRLRNAFKAQGITADKLDKYSQSINPENNVKGLKGKDVIIYASKADLIIKYDHALKLVDAMKKQGVEPKLITNDILGHYGTNMTFILNPKIITGKKTKIQIPELHMPDFKISKLGSKTKTSKKKK